METPPAPGWYKTNVDGAIFTERGQCEIGVVWFGMIKAKSWELLAKHSHTR